MSHACLRARRLAAAIPFVLVLLLVPSASFAADLQATPSNLSSVFSSAQGGDVIHLAAGSYGSFGAGKKASMVTLQADPGVSASIAPDLGSASNVRFKNLTLTSVYIGTGSSYIELVGNKVTGATLIDTANSDMHVLLDGNSHDGINVCSSCYEGRITVKGNNLRAQRRTDHELALHRRQRRRGPGHGLRLRDEDRAEQHVHRPRPGRRHAHRRDPALPVAATR